jgi:hypothetical protein
VLHTVGLDADHTGKSPPHSSTPHWVEPVLTGLATSPATARPRAPVEWSLDILTGLVKFDVHDGKKEKVARGFYGLYTSKNPESEYGHRSAREQAAGGPLPRRARGEGPRDRDEQQAPRRLLLHDISICLNPLYLYKT